MLRPAPEYAAACEIHASARRRLDSAADATPTPVFLLRAGGTVLYANAAAASLVFGRSAEPHVASDGAREVPLHGFLQRLAASAPAGTKRRAAFADGRHFEASVARFTDEEEDVAVLTLRFLSSLSLDDVRARLEERGVSGREAEVVGAPRGRAARRSRSVFITEWTVRDHLKYVFSSSVTSRRGSCARSTGPGPRCEDPRPVPIGDRSRPSQDEGGPGIAV